MKIKKLGRTGLKVTEICLGTMTFANQADEPTSFKIMDIAAEAGVNFFDTADMYPLGATPEMHGNTEVVVGNWLKERKMRDKIVLATKCAGEMGSGANDKGLSRKHIFEAIDASLRRLQTDYIDLYQMHFPDPETPIEETLSALNDLVRAGKVRYIGCSNFPAWRLATALWTSDKLGLARFDSDQPRYNILYREIENEILPLCREQGVGVIVYNPLAGGFLTGRYNPGQALEQGTRFTLNVSGKLYQARYWNDYMFEAVENLKKFFTGRGKSLTHVALAWVLAQQGITSAILGASKPEQLTDSLKGLEMSLDEEEMKMCNSIWYRIPRNEDPGIALR
ncbi:MAG: aldo/keto reductase [Chloroflexi bacterium]|uniref:Aldo/keto reductase n=1 Tax=Candidatus Chlorohelix allophototropha TaxID=3003348 RepID=A0A8T7M9Q1_9CHLR|nr:aldo/keto reductase [Chloroflexota bacterium]WJW68787.1 aldo/keto reductase [Chloroflexota bacterium L227-S17]